MEEWVSVCASNESENWYKVESCSTGVMFSHSACVETCGTGVVTIGDMGALGDLQMNLFWIDGGSEIAFHHR